MDKRKYKRFTAGYYFDIDSDIADKVKIRYISISGICLETSRRINIKSIYSTNIVNKEIGDKNLKGEVVWSKLRGSIKDKDDIIPIYHIGINFIEQNDGNTYLEKLTERLSN